MNIDRIKGWHKGKDIYVLGSGPSLSFIDPEFFRGKIVVSTNKVADRFGLFDIAMRVYTHTHYHCDAQEVAIKHPSSIVVCPEGDRGYAGSPTFSEWNVVFYPHVSTEFDFSADRAWHPNGLIVGSTSMHGAMHLAAHLGASNIILVGADCGMIDGSTNHDGYKSGNLESPDPISWLIRWEYHLRDVKRKLIEEYPSLRIYSLNPFLNFNLEDHAWLGTRS